MLAEHIKKFASENEKKLGRETCVELEEMFDEFKIYSDAYVNATDYAIKENFFNLFTCLLRINQIFYEKSIKESIWFSKWFNDVDKNQQPIVVRMLESMGIILKYNSILYYIPIDSDYVDELIKEERKNIGDLGIFIKNLFRP